VTGTGTGVGKTTVAAAVCALARDRGGRVAYLKTAQTGAGPGDPATDAAEVARLAPGVVTAEGARFPDPLSPEAAARHAGVPPVDLAAVAALARDLAAAADLLVVEGAGGLLVRHDDEGASLADLARTLDAPVLVVAGPELGTLNATALTLEVLAGRGLRLDGLVLGTWPAEPDLAARSNVADLERLAGRPLAGALPAAAGRLAPAAFLPVARGGLAPQYGGSFTAADFRRAADPRPGRSAPSAPA